MPKPIIKGKKPKLIAKKDKLSVTDRASLKSSLKGHGMSQAEVDAIVTADASVAEMVGHVVAIQRAYPKA